MCRRCSSASIYRATPSVSIMASCGCSFEPVLETRSSRRSWLTLLICVHGLCCSCRARPGWLLATQQLQVQVKVVIHSDKTCSLHSPTVFELRYQLRTGLVKQLRATHTACSLSVVTIASDCSVDTVLATIKTNHTRSRVCLYLWSSDMHLALAAYEWFNLALHNITTA